MANVLVCCADTAMSELLRLNLFRRGYVVRLDNSDPCYGPPDYAPHVVGQDEVIADLSCPEPECWSVATSFRSVLPSLPVLFLAYAWPGPGRLEACQPCAYVHKPFAIDEMLAGLRGLLPPTSA